jgi:dTDP-4-amino-4,6-dideoxygalactose transaminase
MSGGRIYLSAPDVGQVEEAFVLDALRSGWVAPVGEHVDRFEAEIANRLGVAAAVALNSGTAALHLGLAELGAGPGDAVLVPTLTFVATANAVRYTGASPVFVDSDPISGTVAPDLVASALATLASEGRRVAAVVAVDLFGSCADYERLLPISAEHGIPLLEDAAEALGAARGGRAAGAFGAAAVLSFNGNKILTTSAGGMLLTQDRELADRVRYLSAQARQPAAHYEHTEIGFNYRMSNVLAAIGRAQLTRLDAMIARRRALRRRYAAQFEGVPGVRLLGGEDSESNCWLTALLVDPPAAGWCAGDLAGVLAQQGIESRPVWKPMHRQPVYAGERRFRGGVADRLFDQGIVLPSGSGLAEDDVDRIQDVIARFLDGVA